MSQRLQVYSLRLTAFVRLDSAIGPKLFLHSGITSFKGCFCLRFRLVSRRLGKLAPVGVTFAFQLGEKTLVTLLAL